MTGDPYSGRWYVIDGEEVIGPFLDHRTAKNAQQLRNDAYGIDADGEGYYNAILLTEEVARRVGYVK